MELIPAIDLRGGRCVRLLQGDFAAETVYADEPTLILERYHALGARRVHVVDLDGARDGASGNAAAIRRLSERNLAQLQVGGGLRDLQTVRQLLRSGIERAVIGSTAATAPLEVLRWAEELGSERLVLAFDVRLDEGNVPRLTTHGWQRNSAKVLWDAVEQYGLAGFRHILCTDVARDGALGGPNCDLYSEAVRRFPGIEWQASGGVAGASDLHALRETGVTAVISGRALLEHRIPPKELRPFLPNASFPA